MATTKKDGPQAKERPSRSSLTPSTTQNPRARPSRPSSPATSEKDSVSPSPVRKPTPNYLKPTFSSSPDAAKMSKATSPSGATRTSCQKTLTGKKGLDTVKPQPQRSSSFNPPKAQKPALASRSSFSERTAARGKSSGLSRIKVDRDSGRRPAGGGPRGKCSTTSSANVSTASSPKAATEETMSNEDREAALDILNLDVEEHVLLEIPLPVVDKAALLPDEELAHEEEYNVAEDPPAAAAPAFVEEEHVLKSVEPHVDEDGSGSHEQPPQENESEHGEEAGKKEDHADEAAEEKGHEELPTTGEVVEEEGADQKAEEAEEKEVVEVSAAEPDGEVVGAKVECDVGGEKEEDGADGGGEGVKLQVSGAGVEGEEEEAAPAQEKRKEPAPQQPGKKEAPPAYNDVIEETASKLVEKRKSKVKALVGAFETVIVMDSGGQAP